MSTTPVHPPHTAMASLSMVEEAKQRGLVPIVNDDNSTA